jgi:demethylmenaquinone methyltransferase/2-methoxy-6-polyprenyl-1,4-benzoquinol methylase
MPPGNSEAIRRMFSEIAPRYDLLNHVLSLDRDRAWRQRACGMLSVAGGERVLDVCAGTGDLALALLSHAPSVREVCICDFAEPMLALARGKADGAARGRMRFVCGDALALPYADGAFDIVTCAFGVRNFASTEDGLRELHRVTTPGGQLLLLEFCRPRPAWYRAPADVFIGGVLPRAGAALSGHPDAYTYLHRSIRAFLSREELAELLAHVGYRDVRCEDLTFGIATAFHGTREP